MRRQADEGGEHGSRSRAGGPIVSVDDSLVQPLVGLGLHPFENGQQAPETITSLGRFTVESHIQLLVFEIPIKKEVEDGGAFARHGLFRAATLDRVGEQSAGITRSEENGDRKSTR